MSRPLFSVGIPTFNRAEKLMRAAASVLAQSELDLQLVISDNASTDETQDRCRALCESDGRVLYLRSRVNRGPTANFNAVFDALEGEYVMVLSDDDWLEPDYLERCHAELLRRPQLALACGRASYLRDGVAIRQGIDMQLEQEEPAQRVLEYLRSVDENGIFYGLMPRAVLRAAAPLQNVMGNDWLLAAAVVAQGKVATIETTALNRELGGTSADFIRLTTTLGLPRWQARIPHLVIAWHVLADIGWRAPAYGSLSRSARARLALTGAWAVISWRSLAWHLTMPAFAALGRMRWGGWLWRGYRRLTGLLGAGRGD